MSIRDFYVDAASAFVKLVTQIPDSMWSAPGLGEWTIQDLVGHANRSLTLVSTYLTGPPPQNEALLDPASYFVLAMASMGDPIGVAQRGRDAGSALGSSPVTVVRDCFSTVSSIVAGNPDDADSQFIRVPVGVMTLDGYLATRIVELVVHGDDLGRALGLASEPGNGAVTVALKILSQLSVLRSDPLLVLRALTGRAALDKGFSVLG